MNEFAVSASDVGTGMQKSASVLQDAGASFEEATGMFVGMNEVMQDASVSGAALKVSAMRLRGMKGELEELGEEVDSSVDSVSKVQTQILNLTGGKVNIFDDKGNFRNITDVYRDIAGVIDTLSDPKRAELTELLFGKNRAAQGLAMLNNWSQVEKAIDAARNAEGTAIQEQEKYMSGLEGKVNAFKASWSAFSNTLISSDFLKGAVDFGTGFVSTLDSIIGRLGTIPSLVGAITAAMSLSKGAG